MKLRREIEKIFSTLGRILRGLGGFSRRPEVRASRILALNRREVKMKKGRNLTDLAAEIQRQAQTKKDFVADTRTIAMRDQAPIIHFPSAPELGEFEVGDYAHGQIADRVGIPKKYYDRMKSEAPALLARNVNHWFQTAPEKRMIRTLDGRARAFLSERYRPLDHFDLAESVLPKILETSCQVVSCEITELKMYIKAVTEKITLEVKRGDVVQAGVVISNSEVGAGSVKVEPLIYRLSCENGMIALDFSVRKHHVGRRSRGDDELEGAREFFRDETRIADDRAFFLKVRDTVDAALTEATFGKIVAKLREATELRIEADPVKVLERVQEKFSLNDNERGSVLNHLISGGELSAYGLANAITRASQDLDDYDRATEFEKLGGEIITLPRSDWQVLAAA